MKHLNISIEGKVQGVSFRFTAKAVADQLGVKGFAQNLADGSVYMEAEGDAFALASFVDFCQEGPDQAVVQDLISQEGALKGFKNFEVLKKLTK